MFLKLQKSATDSELVSLTNHTSKNVVIYSFIALSHRNYNGLKEIFFKHLNDSSLFSISGGCTESIHKVNLFMLNSIQPIQPQGSLNHMTEEEYQFFLKRINN